MHKLLTIIVFASLVFKASIMAQVADKPENIAPLLIGEKIPNTVLISADGNKVNTSAIFSGKNSLLLFYRGGWCPYCNVHLSDIRKAEEKLKKLGYQIIAVSPDSPENLRDTEEKQTLNYDLFSDSNADLMKAMGVALKAPENYQELLLKSSNEKNPGIIPVPSLFIVNNEQEIVFEYINIDYKTRMSSELLLAVIDVLKEQESE